MLTGDNGVITNAMKSSSAHDFASMKEDLEMNRASLDAISFSEGHGAADFSIYVTGEDVKAYIPSMPDKYIGRIAIFDGEMVLVGDNLSQEEQQAAEMSKIKTMGNTDYNYMLELKYLEIAVLNHKDDLSKIGTALGTIENPYETIAGINYGLGWYKISTTAELTSLGLTTEQLGYMNNIPYIVKYSTGAVQSIVGKKMYAGTDNEIWKYTFNYKGEEGGLVVNNILSGVTSDSIKTATQFGELTPNQTYASTGTTAGVIENYYTDDYTYDADDGLILGATTKILNMPIDQTKPINEKLSLNITIKCDTSIQYALPSLKSDDYRYGGTVFSISDILKKYILRVEINHDVLRVYNYLDVENNTNYNSSGMTEMTFPGQKIINISQFNNKYLNIQITSEKGGKTKIYLNGNKVTEYNSSSGNFTYNYCTIGDLRPGRGYKYVGNIYNFALYGDILTDEEIAQNWNYVKNELGINEAGEKVSN